MWPRSDERGIPGFYPDIRMVEISASMWPRSDERGITVPTIMPAFNVFVLQCGRAPMSAESYTLVQGRSYYLPSLQCGRAPMSAES